PAADALALVLPRRGDPRPVLRLVPDLAGHAVAAALGCSGRPPPVETWARDRSMAAAISPLNSGGGRGGRGRDPGWAWVPTKNGCRSRFSSANSTRRPSGDRPENTTPAFSSRSR